MDSIEQKTTPTARDRRESTCKGLGTQKKSGLPAIHELSENPVVDFLPRVLQGQCFPAIITTMNLSEAMTWDYDPSEDLLIRCKI
jgi:hypothetical protein